MERDVAEQRSRLRAIRRYYALVVVAAAMIFAASVGSYYGQYEPILTLTADSAR